MIIAFILIGLTAGLVGNRLVSGEGLAKSGLGVDVFLGVLSAAFGTWILFHSNIGAITPLDAVSIGLAFASGVALVLSLHAFVRQARHVRHR